MWLKEKQCIKEKLCINGNVGYVFINGFRLLNFDWY